MNTGSDQAITETRSKGIEIRTDSVPRIAQFPGGRRPGQQPAREEHDQPEGHGIEDPGPHRRVQAEETQACQQGGKQRRPRRILLAAPADVSVPGQKTAGGGQVAPGIRGQPRAVTRRGQPDDGHTAEAQQRGRDQRNHITGRTLSPKTRRRLRCFATVLLFTQDICHPVHQNLKLCSSRQRLSFMRLPMTIAFRRIMRPPW